ncbi:MULTISPECIES: MATE family efflux transporter [Peptoniphilus]|uniref:MATE family efflux transporter n=1 Tax=Peptoniphilus TaxID=162289 RepID=UPI0007859183|nr:MULTISPECIES: MATE family efflux transporter [Peptoniphilus]KXB69885.1 MATE efflux family protein [Peptoniphilus sp. DNF00840]
MSRKRKSNRNINLTEGSIIQGIILFAIPLLLTNFLQQLYNTADLMIVGRFAGKNPMAAVGATGPVSNLLIGLFLGLTTGASVIISLYYGSNDREALKRSVGCSYFLGFVSGLLITVFGYFTTPFFLRIMDTPQEILQDATTYMRVFFLGTVPILIYNMGASILRATGDSKRPFNFLCVSALVNIVLDLIFVGYLQMSVLGAGLATLASQVTSAILVTYSLLKADSSYKLRKSEIKLHKHEAKRIFEVGIPTGVQTALLSLTNVIFQAKINSFGPNAIAGVAAEGRIDGFIFMSLQAIALAATTFSGQNFGAKKFDRLREGMRVSLMIVFGISFILSLIAYFLASPLIAIFNPDPGVVAYGADFLKILSLGIWSFGLSETISGFIRGSGHAMGPMIISLLTICILRLVVVHFAMPIFNSIRVISVIYPVSYFANLVIMALYFKFGSWRKDFDM